MPPRLRARPPGLRAEGRLWLLPLVACSLVAMTCGPKLSLNVPADADLLDESPVDVSAQVAKAFQPASVQLLLDGVDLIAALGLTPPFTSAGGAVNVGGDIVTVSNFDYDPTPPGVTPLTLQLAGLVTGDHQLELIAQQPSKAPVSRVRDFGTVLAFSQPAQLLDSGALAAPISLGSEGSLVGASLGQPLAGPPVPLAAGSEVRPGFLAVREELITGDP